MSLLGVIAGASRRRGGGYGDAFVLEVKTDNTGTSDDDQFTLPTFTSGTYDYNVDWGDGTDDDFTGATSRTHTYPVAGTYEVKITGVFPRIFFNNGGDRLKLLEVLNWGSVGFSNTQAGAFFGCANLSSLAAGATWSETVTVANNMFRNCTSLTQLPADMTLAALLNGSSMFHNTALTSLPSGMTLAALETATSMFQNTALTSLPSGMTLAALVTGTNMFRDNPLTSLPSGMTLAALTSGSGMFVGSTINTTRYSQLLVDLENLNPNNSVAFHGGNSKYNPTGQTARNTLTTAPRSWSIADGGLE